MQSFDNVGSLSSMQNSNKLSWRRGFPFERLHFPLVLLPLSLPDAGSSRNQFDSKRIRGSPV